MSNGRGVVMDPEFKNFDPDKLDPADTPRAWLIYDEVHPEGVEGPDAEPEIGAGDREGA